MNGALRLLVTGASGYVGRAFVAHAVGQGADVMALTRRKPDPKLPCPFMMPSNWQDETLLAKAMEGRSAIIHLAGLAHNKPGDMHGVNHELTLSIARAARNAGVGRFIFVSSAAVFGEPGSFAVKDTPAPRTDYGASKFQAEQDLRTLFATCETRLHIVRAPAIVGPDAPGHGMTLARYAKYPLPLGNLPARRSYINMDDMVQFLFDLSGEEDEPSALWHVGTDTISASELIRHMAAVQGIKLTLFPFPAFLLKALPLKGLRPLLTDHVLVSGRAELDSLVY